jgi:methionyl-tRNA formyltransferase
MKPSSTRVIFMGSPAFAEPTLRALNSAGYLIPLVLTQPDKPAGRGSRLTPPPVKVLAQQLGIEVFQPASLKTPEVEARLRSASPDVLVVAAYGKIIPASLLVLPKRGSLNVHASLLPRWRGASPVAAAILAGDSTTGVSIMEVVQQMDAGPVVARDELAIEPSDTTGTLESRLARCGATLLVDVLPRWYDGELVPQPQDEARASYCSLIRKEDGHLRRETGAAQAERMVRAYDPWPGAFVQYRGQRLGIWKARVEPLSGESDPGTLVAHNREPAIAFPDALLMLEEVQRQGARRMSGRDFLNGERGHLPIEVGLA